jgi:hypothetical protein
LGVFFFFGGMLLLNLRRLSSLNLGPPRLHTKIQHAASLFVFSPPRILSILTPFSFQRPIPYSLSTSLVEKYQGSEGANQEVARSHDPTVPEHSPKIKMRQQLGGWDGNKQTNIL